MSMDGRYADCAGATHRPSLKIMYRLFLVSDTIDFIWVLFVQIIPCGANGGTMNTYSRYSIGD